MVRSGRPCVCMSVGVPVSGSMQCCYHPNLVSSKIHDHVSKFTIPSLSHNEQHLPTKKMLNESSYFFW